MRGRRIVIIVGKSPALDTALDAMAELALPVRVIPTVREAERALLGADRPLVDAVLVGLDPSPEDGIRLVRSLRQGPFLASVPIAVWARGAHAVSLADAYMAGATSGILLDGSDEDPIRLARMIHYWAAANEPPLLEVPA